MGKERKRKEKETITLCQESIIQNNSFVFEKTIKISVAKRGKRSRRKGKKK